MTTPPKKLPPRSNSDYFAPSGVGQKKSTANTAAERVAAVARGSVNLGEESPANRSLNWREQPPAAAERVAGVASRSSNRREQPPAPAERASARGFRKSSSCPQMNVSSLSLRDNEDSYKRKFSELRTLLDKEPLTDHDSIKKKLTEIALDDKFPTLKYNFYILRSMLNFIINEGDINPSVIDKIFEKANDIKFLTFPKFQIGQMRTLLAIMKEISPCSVRYTEFAQAMLLKIPTEILTDKEINELPSLLHMITTLRAFDAERQMAKGIPIESLLAEELPLKELILQVLEKISLQKDLEGLPIEHKTQLLQTQAYIMLDKPIFEFEEIKKQMKKDATVSRFQNQVKTVLKKIYIKQETRIEEEFVLPLAYAYHSVDIFISEFDRGIYIECDGRDHLTQSGEKALKTILRDQIYLRARYHEQLQQAKSECDSMKYDSKYITISIKDWEGCKTEEEQRQLLTSLIES